MVYKLIYDVIGAVYDTFSISTGIMLGFRRVQVYKKKSGFPHFMFEFFTGWIFPIDWIDGTSRKQDIHRPSSSWCYFKYVIFSGLAKAQ